MTNRGDYITKCESKYAAMLKIHDVVQMLRLWKTVTQTDHIIEFLLFWGRNLAREAFAELFQAKFYPEIDWKRISKKCMTKVHELQLLTPMQENNCLVNMMTSAQFVYEMEKEIYVKSELDINIKTMDKNEEVRCGQITVRCKTFEEKSKLVFAKKKSLCVGQGDVIVENVPKVVMDKFKVEKYWSRGINVDPQDVAIRIMIKKQRSSEDKWEEELNKPKSVVAFEVDEGSDQKSTLFDKKFK